MSTNPIISWHHYSLPVYGDKRSVLTRYVHFNIDDKINPQNFLVWVEHGNGFKTLGTLRSSIRLPDVHFDPRAKVIVTGVQNGVRTRYHGRLIGGGIYTVPYLPRGGEYIMGTLRVVQ